MDARLETLKLILAELGIEPEIETIDQRVVFQKAIYLAQAAGVPLHYRYNWYVMGPYSPNLTKDYYALHAQRGDADHDQRSYVLKDQFVSLLRSLKPAMAVPEGVPLRPSEWLELLSSVHYLRIQMHLNPADTQKSLDQMKPHVSPYARTATGRLGEVGLIMEQRN